ncbi:MAG: class III poly(R)-hydroxyalkanoic acid synthase subunit PhaC [Gammaproteobacteria bacterium]|nr:class III poly(R)-hydroxyalkanoic acid synthase subunit PhaC [Gammaproteobacteria bacterium]
MPRVRITPEKMRAEITELGRKLGAGVSTLQAAKDVELGACARREVFKIDNVVLYHYRARTARENPVPVLVVYALVNRPDMADLQHDRSLIRSLLDRGLDIYLIDWGYPDGADRALSLDDYICRYIDACVNFVSEANEVERINLLGICQGGTFSVCYSALYPEKVRNLIPTVTPIDFHTRDDMLSHLFRHVDVDLLVDSSGNISGDLLNLIFLSLKPFRLAQQKYVHMLDGLDDEEATRMFVRMEKWIFDSPALAGEAFRQFAGGFYQNNDLIKGNIEIGGRKVDLKALGMPILNIYARDDHLVPPPASLALGEYAGSDDYKALEFPGGHIGIYVSSRAHVVLPKAIQEWLGAR